MNGVSAREAIQGIKFALQLDQIKHDIDNLTRERAQLKSDIDQSLRELVEFNQKKISIQKEIDVLNEAKKIDLNELGFSEPNYVIASAGRITGRIKRQNHDSTFQDYRRQTVDIDKNGL